MKLEISSKLPVILVSDSVVFPSVTVKIPLRAKQNVALAEEVLLNVASLQGSMIVIGYRKETHVNDNKSIGSVGSETGITNLHSVGTAALVSQVVGRNWPRPSYVIQVTGLCRVKLKNVLQMEPYVIASVDQLDRFQNNNKLTLNSSDEATFLQLSKTFLADRFSASNARLQQSNIFKQVMSNGVTETSVDLICAFVHTSYNEKLHLLDTVDVETRVTLLNSILGRQTKADEDEQVGAVEMDDDLFRMEDFSRVFKSMSPKRGRLQYPESKGDNEIVQLESKIRSAGMPPQVEEMCLKELKKLQSMSPSFPDASSLRNYLELLVELPWSKTTDDKLNVEKARTELEADHFGLTEVKKRILEFLAVRQLKQTMKGPILCFVGPPGVGKTSVARSIAKSMGRNFERISLGGISDQSEIRGHRRTYVGSMPGRIIQCMKRTGTNNPVILLDEVDKLSAGLHGDPSAALLEVLDPAQNHTFTDHYVNVPFDLSKVLFIATANSISSIPAPLLDRMETIYISGYTLEEKTAIAIKFLLPELLKQHGLTPDEMQIADSALRFIVSRYTREAGVRGLERRLGGVCRAVALRVVDMEGRGDTIKNSLPIVIDESALQDILGMPVFDITEKEVLSQPGVAAGLAWTPVGGTILYVEAVQTEGGQGRLTLTGQLGDVMKESARVALTWLRNHVLQTKVTTEVMEKKDIHIHFPVGGVSKDGPSAGVTVLVALASLFTQRPARYDTAMTGEITLRGLVLPVGGVKEKILAAHTAGFTRLILPKLNSKDLTDVSDEIKSQLEIVLVSTMEEVVEAALLPRDFHLNSTTRVKSSL